MLTERARGRPVRIGPIFREPGTPARMDASVKLFYATAAGLAGRHRLDLTLAERETLRREIED